MTLLRVSAVVCFGPHWTNTQNPTTMRTRIALLTTSLLFATAVVFAQTKPTAPAPHSHVTARCHSAAICHGGPNDPLSGTAYKVSTKRLMRHRCRVLWHKEEPPPRKPPPRISCGPTIRTTTRCFTHPSTVPKPSSRPEDLSSFGALQGSPVARKSSRLRGEGSQTGDADHEREGEHLPDRRAARRYDRSWVAAR